MIAIDTNVVVRYLVADEPEQFERATALIEGRPVFVCTTVILEVEWVLRAIYRLDRSAILHGLRDFAALPTVAVEDRSILSQALDCADQGMDFADALHLASSAACDAFASFDRDLARTATRLGALAVRAP
jgi:predicted nucleic-acid-binding protein